MSSGIAGKTIFENYCKKNAANIERAQAEKPAESSWCGPCRMVSPVIDELSAEHPEYKFVKVNVDEQTALASQYNVMSIPNLVVFKNGTVVSQSAGARPKEEILALLGK